VKQETASELLVGEGEGAANRVVSVVLVTEGDTSIFKTEKSAIGEGDAMGIASQVMEDLLGTAEGRFGVESPIGGAQGMDQGAPSVRVSQGEESSVESQLSLLSSLLEQMKKATSEEAAENEDRQEEARASRDPAGAIC